MVLLNEMLMLKAFRIGLVAALLLPMACHSQGSRPVYHNYVKENYDKQEAFIPMRDGKKLYTAIYTPKDQSQSYPILMERTPYSAGPYGDSVYKGGLGPNAELLHGKYIFVYQDVRGRHMSEGDFQIGRAHV